jgi:hypothetical protein
LLYFYLFIFEGKFNSLDHQAAWSARCQVAAAEVAQRQQHRQRQQQQQQEQLQQPLRKHQVAFQ